MNAHVGSYPILISTRDIANLTGLTHATVMRDTRAMLDSMRGNIQRVTESSYQTPQGITFPAFDMPKRECMILISGYNAERRAPVNGWWNEREATAQAAVESGTRPLMTEPATKAVRRSLDSLAGAGAPPTSPPRDQAPPAGEPAKLPEPCEGRIGDALVQTVSARGLHAYLEVGKDFSTWIKDRIAAYSFNENSDFVIFPETGENSGAGRPGKGYALTLDMAKELAMVERNDRGKEARRYYIECERKLRAQSAPAIAPDFSDPAVLLTHLIEQTRGRAEDQRRAAAAEAKADEVGAQLDALSASDGSMCFQVAGKTIGLKRCNDVFGIAELEKWIYRHPESRRWRAHQDKLVSRYLEHVPHQGKDKQGNDCVYEQVVVTAKGLVRLTEIVVKKYPHKLLTLPKKAV